MSNNTLTTRRTCQLHASHISTLMLQEQRVRTAPKENPWFDVGIMKVTNAVVTHYYVPYDDGAVEVRLPALGVQVELLRRSGLTVCSVPAGLRDFGARL